MKFLLSLSLSLVCLSSVNAQDIIFEERIDLGQEYSMSIQKTDKNDSSYPIVYPETGKIDLVINDKEVIGLVSLNSSLEIENKITMARPDNHYTELHGHSFSGGIYYFFYSDSKHKDFMWLSMDKTTGKTGSGVLHYHSKKRKFLQSFSHKDKFYLVSYIKEKTGDKLELIVYNSANDFFEKEFDFDYKQFGVSTVDELTEMSKIKMGSNYSMFEATYPIKLYYRNDEMNLTFDYDDEFTHLISVDLIDFQLTTYKYPNSEVKKSYYLKNNSFLTDKYLFQIMVDKDILTLKIRDWRSGELIREYSFDKDAETIPFGNSPFIARTDSEFLGFQISDNEPFKPEEVLDYLSKYRLGISVYESNQKSYVAIGGLSGYVLGTGINQSNIGFSPGGLVIFIYNSFFVSILDTKSLEHLDEEFKENAKMKASKFLGQNKSFMSNVCAFTIDDYLLVAYANLKNRKYTIRLFTDE